jgi:serine/threonine-protein kinase
VPLPPATLVGGLIGFPAVAITPDGKQLAFVGIHDGIRQIYLRPFDTYEATPIAGTEGATDPFFSPDGQWLGFVANRRMKRVALSGGAPVNLLNTPYNFFGLTWGPRNTIAYTPQFDSAIWELPVGGGNPRELTKLDRNKKEVGHHWPEWLPGGDAILFTVLREGNSWDEASIEAQRIDTGERHVLVEGGTYPRYAASGHLLYMRSGSLMAVPFDRERLQVTGSPVSVVNGVMQGMIGSGQFSVSRRGDLAYVPGAVQSGEMTLVLADRHGATRPLPVVGNAYHMPRLSPDGSRVAVWIIRGTRCEVTVYHLANDTWTRLTFGEDNHAPVWSPDGTRVVYQSTSARGYDLFWTRADGGGATEQLTHREQLAVAGSFTPDGRLLAFADFDLQTGWDIWTMPLDGDRKARLFLQTPANELMPVVSPDGRWLAYATDESGRSEVFVRAFPGPGGPWQISADGGSDPVWTRSGKELIYRQRESIMAVEISTESGFTPSKPTRVTKLLDEPFDHYWGRNWDVTPDGKRFLMVKTRDEAMQATHINVVLHWLDQLRSR